MYRSLIAVGLAGCVAFDSSPPNRTPDAMPARDAALPDGTETAAQAAERVTARFQACMTLSDFVEAGMTVWGQLPTTNGETCTSCHGHGENAFFASLDAPTFFAALQTNRFLLIQYLTVDLADGTALAKMVVNATKLTALGGAEGTPHPAFDAEPGLEVTERFRLLTESPDETGCGP